jgi:hypothetical protein
MTDALKSIVGEVPDSTTLQLEYEQKRDSPKEVVGIIEGLDNRSFRGLDDQIDWVSDRGKRVFKSLPVRLVAGVLVLGFAAEEANRGDLWFCDKVLGQPDKSGFASAYMSAAYYYLRRYAGANDSQARMSVK